MTLKQFRVKSGLSQNELANISGVNLRSLQDYEQGHKLLSSAKGETLLRLGRTLGVSIEELLGSECGGIEIPDDNYNRKLMEHRIRVYENALCESKKILHFPLVIKDEFVDMSRIYPTKQRIIKNIIDNVRDEQRVDSIVLFGSSITMRCNRDSDVDLAVSLYDPSVSIKNDISELIQESCDYGADIIWMDRITPKDRIYADIMEGLKIV